MKPPRSRARRGVSLIELSVSLTIMGVLISFAAPSFTRAVEQSKADVAGGNLRAIWSAQRLYRLDNPAYAGDLNALVAAGLLDAGFPDAPGSKPAYAYAVAGADAQSFTVTATRSGGPWSGGFAIDPSGNITGAVSRAGEADIAPGFF